MCPRCVLLCPLWWRALCKHRTLFGNLSRHTIVLDDWLCSKFLMLMVSTLLLEWIVTHSTATNSVLAFLFDGSSGLRNIWVLTGVRWLLSLTSSRQNLMVLLVWWDAIIHRCRWHPLLRYFVSVILGWSFRWELVDDILYLIKCALKLFLFLLTMTCTLSI